MAAGDLQAWNGSNWGTVVSAIRAFDGADWDQYIKKVWSWNGSAWVQVWQWSDPQTYQWYADWSQTYYKNTGNQRATDKLYQGYYSASPGEHYSLIHFDEADIRAKLAVRPVITSIRLRLTSDHFYLGDFNNPIGYTRHGGHNYATKPTTWDGTEVYAWNNATYGKEHTWTGGYAGARHHTEWITLPTAVGNLFRDDSISGLTLNARTTVQTYYCYMMDQTAELAAERPLLEITCDYT